MRFLGKGHSGANAQGWEVNGNSFFAELQSKHPEYFDRLNTNRILKEKTAPEVNKTFIQHFPEYRNYEHTQLIHHHIGGDGQAVAVPKPLHNGYGEIHNVEKALPIRRNALRFSKSCAKQAQGNSALLSKSADEFHQLVKSEGQTLSNAFTDINPKKSELDQNNGLTLKIRGNSRER